jgi:myosin heavy subunit
MPLDKLKPMHPTSASGVEDMITLGDLHESSLFHNLCLRHQKDEIYTFTGNILVAVNPYKSLPIYGGDYIKKYQGKALNECPPHIYGIANETLLKSKQNQCVVIRFVMFLFM